VDDAGGGDLRLQRNPLRRHGLPRTAQAGPGSASAIVIGGGVDELRSNSPVFGTPDEVVDKLAPFFETGVERVYLQLLDLSDLDQVQFFAEAVVPQLG
jgi:alkanesulfonate monooxygenase SsuD/methylene tetrahydromethanopterin reductase-like flavin-dependent oxidoreductase (luciferase family)